MKHIGIDARLYSKTGVGVYIRNLLHYIDEIAPPDLRFTVYMLPEDIKKVHFNNTKISIQPVSYLWHTFGEQMGFYQQLQKDSLDLMHFTYFSYPVMYKKPFIATIHDTILLHNKTGLASTRNPLVYELKHRIFKFVYFSQLRNAKKVITPTQTVKDQLVELAGGEYADKITVIYEGVDYTLASTIENNLSISYPYILYVGNFYPHKNVETLIRSLQFMSRELKLVLVGPGGYFLNRIKSLINELRLSDQVVFFPDATTADMVYLYKHAKALVQPSREEGFGLPLIEALYFGTPVVASDIPVFHELLGETFSSFDPTKPEDIGASITACIGSERKKNVDQIVTKYNFKTMSAQIVELYEKETGSTGL